MSNISDIAILVDNQSGVLTRVSGLFTRRGFNIHSLTVSETEDPAFSRITISAEGDEGERTQIIKQLKKLYNVKEIKVMERDHTVKRELALIKLKNSAKTRSEIVSAVDIYRSKIIDYSPNTLCVEITGESSKIDAFIKIVQPYGILEMCRTGVVALERGCHYLRADTETIDETEGQEG
jgi:acetolactate synthase-1/3 small subunit